MTKVSLDSRAVLITGASSGIGAACALELDRRGYRVLAGVRRPASGERLPAHASSRLTPLRIDVAEPEWIAAAAEMVSQAVGSDGLAGLVNNAGIVISGPLELLPMEEIRNQFEVNVLGPLALTQALLPLLRRGRGRIVNISSISGAISSPFLGPYAASKFAIEALSDALRMELRNANVRVSLVEPGPVATPIWDKSIATAGQIAETIAPERLQWYQADIDAVEATTKRWVARAMPMEWVVDAVVHALSAKRPKARYFITMRTKLAFRAMRWLPDRLRDWMVLREFGLR